MAKHYREPINRARLYHDCSLSNLSVTLWLSFRQPDLNEAARAADATREVTEQWLPDG